MNPAVSPSRALNALTIPPPGDSCLPAGRRPKFQFGLTCSGIEAKKSPA